jgi:nitrile hydratase
VSGADRYVSHADLGGTIDRTRVEPEPEGVTFHHEWEARALALTIAAGASGAWNLDMSRRYRETLPDYAELSYYEIWTAALERLVVDRGLVTEGELAAGHAETPPVPVRAVLTADRVANAIARGGPTERPPSTPPRFVVGDRVRTRAGHVDHHTRLPGYAAGRVGTVERVHGVHVFPDTHAHDEGEQPRWLYSVAFDAADLWPDAPPRQCVTIDAWEPYLEPYPEPAP